MADSSYLDDDVFLKGALTVRVVRHDGRPVAGQRVILRGCGFG